MKIHYIFTLILCAIALSASAQKSEPVYARIYYKYNNLKDTIASNKTREEDMILFLGQNMSLFGSFSKIKHEISEEQKFIARTETNLSNKPKAFIVDNLGSKWMTTNTFILNLKEEKLYTTSILAFTPYLVEEKSPKIEWTIHKDTLTIGGLLCKRASTNFENQQWEVYFTESIPSSTGPYKLHGLPGLIIEARTKDQSMSFQFNGLEDAKEKTYTRLIDVTKRANSEPGDYNAIDQVIGRDMGNAYFENYIRISPQAIKVSKEGLKKLINTYEKDPKGFTRQMLN